MAGKYGLIGRDIAYSFSKKYFTEKFNSLEGLEATYENFDLPDIGGIESVFRENPDLQGLNVTIPYKEAIIPYLTELDEEAAAVGAVNTIALSNGKRTGHNTDVIGFKNALVPFLKKYHNKALVLGTGGASKAVHHVLKELGLKASTVSRDTGKGHYTYQDLTEAVVADHGLIVNCTPLGTYPGIDQKPAIPYRGIGKNHILFDLVYNPPKSAFLREGEQKGATIINGLKMLELQAEASWEIWQGTKHN